MQIYAYDEKGEEVAAHQATRRAKYYCPDCHQALSFRSSPLMRAHFFHLKDQRPCFQTSKSLTHLEIQSQIVALLPQGEAKMERRFNELSRIADVYWEKQKIVFEVQYSFITSDELEARIRAYRSIGCQIVWILHTGRYGKAKVTAAEHTLQNYPHYFSNHTPEGIGHFFDQYSYQVRGRRAAALFKRPINISVPKTGELKNHLPFQLKQHRSQWDLGFEGDILNTGHFKEWELRRAQQIESLLVNKKYKFNLKKKIGNFFRLIGYLILDTVS